MSKHTAGPWESLGPTIYDRPIIMAGDYEAATPIAVTYGRKSFDEHDANTRLIAASPDLLEALIAMTDAFLDTDGSHGSAECDAMDKAYAAIDAARAMP